MQKKISRQAIIDCLSVGSAPTSDFDLNPEARPAAETPLRDAGVLVPLRARGQEISLVLTKRASGLKHHPGQISFPGGRVEETDRDVTAAALREAHEEIGLPAENVDVLGLLPPHRTVTNFKMQPVLGWIREDFVPRPELGEVSEVFEVPLAHVLDPSRYIVQSRRWRGQRRYYYTVPFGPYYIWGATARVLRRLAESF